jgi:hypothetical protein
MACQCDPLAYGDALPHIKSAFATVSNSLPRKGLLVCSARPDRPFLPLLQQQQALSVTKREADFT